MIAVQAPPAEVAPAPSLPLRAQYGWGYAGPDGEGVGTLNLLMEASRGRLVLELFAPGERLALLEGDAASGYRLQIPRQKVDRRMATLEQLPLPFLPRFSRVEELIRLLRTGDFPGATVTRRDADGPVKLHWRGRDPKGREEQVWLDRKRWAEGP